MDVAPKPGMWITQNLISHQGDYNIFHVKDVRDRQVYLDVMIRLHTGTRKDYIFGSFKTNFESHEGVYNMPIYVFRKAGFQVMKRPSAPIRRGAIRVLFEEGK